MSKEISKFYTMLGKKRQSTKQRTGQLPSGRRLRDCPVPGCPAKGLKRVDGHLAAVHHLNKQSANYKLLLMQASPAADVPSTPAICIQANKSDPGPND
ncbi:hypothetical protein HOLleu_26364 [Holothuria leucospilota]|uniref:Uncharacterized protein n=1 Tax=Holothuria leucospilota TaxID=206669 RepID=A0A9Q1H554_HOLLE|nr:hypothetical protein HOLleu_26364 [Holothuria leucospilota]